MLRFIFLLLFSISSFAGSDVDDIVKKNISQINNFAAESILDFLGGPGTTEVEVKGLENKKPEYSVMMVRPFSLSTEHSFFSQMQLNHYYIRNDGRVAINLGIGYRKIFNDNYILGVIPARGGSKSIPLKNIKKLNYYLLKYYLRSVFVLL